MLRTQLALQLLGACWRADGLRAGTSRHIRMGLMEDGMRFAAVPALAEWVESQGGECTCATGACVPSQGIGLEAARDVRSGEAVVTVPDALAITSATALRSSIGSWLSDFDPQLSDFALIALALIHERRLGDQSAWGAWFGSGVWPTDLDDLPLAWAAESGAGGDGGEWWAPAQDRLAAVEADHAWLQENVFDNEPMLFPSAVFSLEEYTKAHVLAYSRCTWIEGSDDDDDDGADERPALIPMVDLANHAEYPSVELKHFPAKTNLFGKEEAPARFELRAYNDLPAGSPLTLSYLAPTSSDMLLDYGFLESPVRAQASTACVCVATAAGVENRAVPVSERGGRF